MRSESRKAVWLAGGVMLIAGLLAIPGNRGAQSGGCCLTPLCLSSSAAEATNAAGTNATAKAALPRLVDLGADKCVPCKAMAPILKELKAEYEGRMEVVFIDVWKTPEAGKPYKIQLIPTQIFFDGQGKELFRHEGFFSKKDILAKWKHLGVDLKSEARNPKAEDK